MSIEHKYSVGDTVVGIDDDLINYFFVYAVSTKRDVPIYYGVINESGHLKRQFCRYNEKECALHRRILMEKTNWLIQH